MAASIPAFWRTFVHRKMTVECGSVWEYLEHPVTGENPYLEAVEKNLARIEDRIARLDGMHATA